MARSSFHLVDAKVEVTTHAGERRTLDICGIPTKWKWDVMTRDAAELWAVIDYVSDTFDFENFHVVCWSSTEARRQNCGERYRNKSQPVDIMVKDTE